LLGKDLVDSFVTSMVFIILICSGNSSKIATIRENLIYLDAPQPTAKRLVSLLITVDRKKAIDSAKPTSPMAMTCALAFYAG
jgi:hypothetical protein